MRLAIGAPPETVRSCMVLYGGNGAGEFLYWGKLGSLAGRGGNGGGCTDFHGGRPRRHSINQSDIVISDKSRGEGLTVPSTRGGR